MENLLTNIVFLIIFIMVPIFFVFMMKVSGLPIMTVSVPVLFTIAYLTFSYLGIGPLFFHMFSYTVAIGVTDRYLILRLFFYSATTLVLIGLGFLFCSRILEIRVSQPIPLDRSLSGVELLVQNLLFFSCIVVLLLYVMKLPGIALFAAIKGNAGQAELLRSASVNAFPGKYYRYGIFIDTLLPFLSYMSLSHALVHRRLSSWIGFASIASVALFAALMATIKAKSVFIAIGFMIVYLLARGVRIKFKHVIIIVLGSFLALLPMYLYFMGLQGRSIGDISDAIFARVLVVQVFPGYYYLKMFPNIEGYLWGRSFPNPGGIFPWPFYPLSVEVMNYAFPQLAARGIVGSAPSAFWAELYANFGPAGPLLGAPLVGSLLYLSQALLSRLRESPVSVALITWIALHLMKLSILGISTYVLDENLLAVGVVGCGLLYIEGRGRILLKPVRELQSAHAASGSE